MSTNLGDQVLLASGKVSTPTTGDIQWCLPPADYDYYITAVICTAWTAGAQSASELRVRTATPTTIVGCVIGTTAQRGKVSAYPTVANALVPAGTALDVVHITTDGSAVYFWQIFGTMLHN